MDLRLIEHSGTDNRIKRQYCVMYNKIPVGSFPLLLILHIVPSLYVSTAGTEGD